MTPSGGGGPVCGMCGQLAEQCAALEALNAELLAACKAAASEVLGADHTMCPRCCVDAYEILKVAIAAAECAPVVGDGSVDL